MFGIHLCSLKSQNSVVFDSLAYEDSDGLHALHTATVTNANTFLSGANSTHIELQPVQPNTVTASLFQLNDRMVFNLNNYGAPIILLADGSNPSGWVHIELPGIPPPALSLVNPQHFKVWRQGASWTARNSALEYSYPTIEGSRTSGNKMFTITRNVTRAECSSTADDGFVRATISAKKNGLDQEIITSDITNWTLLITSPHGPVWEGYVSSCSSLDDEITIECSGYKSKLDDVFYGGYFDDSDGNTSPVIIRDILRSIESVLEFAEQSIDREVNDAGSDLHALQYALHGIGPKDFTGAKTTARSALNDILRLGAYGTDDISALAVQIWDGKVARTQILRSKYYAKDAQWVINDGNLPSGFSKGFTLDRSKFYNAFFVSYRETDGSEAYTSSKYNVRDVTMNGVKEQMIAGGNILIGETIAIIDAKLQDSMNTGSIGDLQVVGDVLNQVRGSKVPAYMIRGGDVLFVAGYNSSTIPFSNGSENSSVVLAGEVTCNLIDNTASITPYGHPDKAELVINQLEI
jgi:hypothetical protein